MNIARKLILLTLLLAAPAMAYQILGAEVFRRQLTVPSVVRVYHNGVLLSEVTTPPGDVRITVAGLPPVTVTGFLVPLQLTAGEIGSGTVTVSAPATVARPITLTTSNGTALTTPTAITLPAGATTAPVPLLARTVASDTPVTLRATLGASSRTASLIVKPSTQPVPIEVLSVSMPAEVIAEQTGEGQVVLTAPATFPGGTGVTLRTNSPVLQVPETVMVGQGDRVAKFVWTAGNPPAGTPGVAQEVTLSAQTTSGELTRQFTVRVMPKPEPPDPGPDPTPGVGWYVSPSGSPGNTGSIDSPWDLESTINGTRRSILAAGGTVYLLPGTYLKSPNPEGLGFRCVVGGSAQRPLLFRAAPFGRVTLDGGWSFFPGASDTWLWGVEIISSGLVPGKPPFGLSGSWPEGAANGGYNVYGSVRCKGINLVLHNNRQGASIWTEAVEHELYGCLIYDNGWKGSDRAHGHGIYIQNPPTTTKLVENNILTHTAYSVGWGDGRYGFHGYGERVAVTNITAKGNILYGMGDAWLQDDGAPLGPSTGHQLIDNVIGGVRIRLGSRQDQPLLLDRNLMAFAELQGVGTYTGGQWVTPSWITMTGNVISPPEPLPAAATARLWVNRYEPYRAHLAVVDWRRTGSVRVELAPFVQPGDWLQVRDPTAFYGTPIWTGNYPPEGLTLAVKNGTQAYVLVKQQVAGDGIRPPGGQEPVNIRERIEEAPVLKRLRR